MSVPELYCSGGLGASVYLADLQNAKRHMSGRSFKKFMGLALSNI
jgi:hypothetical protein